jgi:hypothetical protein
MMGPYYEKCTVCGQTYNPEDGAFAECWCDEDLTDDENREQAYRYRCAIEQEIEEGDL